MTALADVFVQGRVDTKRFGPDIKSGMSSPAVRSSMSDAGKASGGMFSGAFKNALKIGAAITGAAAVAGGAFLKDAVGEAREAAKVGALTEQVIKTTGGAANVSAKQVSALAEAISRKAGVDDEAIQSASNLLLTFTNVRNEVGKGNKVFDQATQIATDMGAALGNEPRAAAIQLGKALNDPVKGITALSRVGVSFTEQQKEQIKGFVAAGDTMSAQKVILGELRKEFGGAAEAAASPADRARVAWGNFKEDVGTALLPVLDRLANWFVKDALPAVRDFGNYFNAELLPRIKDFADIIRDDVIPVVRGMAKWILDNKEAVGTFVAVLGGMLIINKIVLAVKAFNLVLRANPIGLVITALALLAAGLVYAYKRSETFRNIVDGAWKGVREAAKFAWENVLKPTFKFLVDAFTRAWDTAKAFKRGIGDAWRAVKDGTKTAVLFVAEKVLWMAEKMLGAMAAAFGWVPGLGDKLKKAHGAIKDFRTAVNREMDAIKDEQVNITFAVGRRKGQESSNSGFGPQATGGAGPIPRGAMGGDLAFNTHTDGAGVRSIAAQARSTANTMATKLRKELLEDLRKEARASGPAGRAGRVLPRGAYSIGMPFLGYPGHYGADYPAASGTPVSSPWAGRVVTSADLFGSNPYNSTPYRSYGRYIKIAHDNGMSTLYAHLSARGVSAGQAVRAGQFIGRVGTTGNSSGPHLHFEVARNGAKFNPAQLGIFDKGGIMRGLGINLSGKPERVLSPRQTDLYDRQITALESLAANGGQSELVALLRALRSDVQGVGPAVGRVINGAAAAGRRGQR